MSAWIFSMFVEGYYLDAAVRGGPVRHRAIGKNWTRVALDNQPTQATLRRFASHLPRLGSLPTPGRSTRQIEFYGRRASLTGRCAIESVPLNFIRSWLVLRKGSDST